jgi:gas vesicle protein
MGKNKENSKLVMAAIVGAAAGALAGVLFAPESGEKSRKKIKKKALKMKDDFAEGVENAAAKGMENVNGLKDDIKESAQNLINSK